MSAGEGSTRRDRASGLSRAGRKKAARKTAAKKKPATKRNVEARKKATAKPEGLPACPRCSAPLIEGARGYGCSAWKTG